MKKVVESYNIKVGKLVVKVKILGEISVNREYNINMPEFSEPTQALYDNVKIQLMTQVPLNTEEVSDIQQIEALRKRFTHEAERILLNRIPTLSTEMKDILVARLVYDMLGIGLVDYLLYDENLEEVIINSVSEPVRIYHRKYGWLKTNVFIKTEADIRNYSDIIARRVGRQISTLTPILDAQLITGDRVNAVLNPISTKGHTITIRRFARDPWTMTDFMVNKTIDSKLLSLVWLAMQYEMNMIISGGTGSGKTSMLNIMMPFIPPNHRIVSIEDTRELQLPEFLYWCPLVTRMPNSEGKGEISMLDLVINALRMRPDRIIMGEVRKKRDAEVLFEAMHTGHSVYATLHADSMAQTISRLINPPIEVAPNMLESVNLNIVMFRDRRRGFRRTYQVGEFLVEEKEGKVSVVPNILFRHNPSEDTIVEHASGQKLFEDISRHTGLNEEEIVADLKEKKQILDYMTKHRIRRLQSVGKIMNDYYSDNEELMKKIKGKKVM